jgi:hypothetical protein
VHHGKDLIVTHIAVETTDPKGVFDRLNEMKVPYRQNVSVPDPKKARNNLEEDFSSDKGKISQYFVRDPDGYYLELCNCDVLTKFCLEKEDKKPSREKTMMGNSRMTAVMSKNMGYSEGGTGGISLRLTVALIVWVARARRQTKMPPQDLLDKFLKNTIPALTADPDKLATMLKRRKTYCDILQGYQEDDVEWALLKSGNSVPLAILILTVERGSRRVLVPPDFFETRNGRSTMCGTEGTISRQSMIGKVMAIKPPTFTMPSLRGNINPIDVSIASETAPAPKDAWTVNSKGNHLEARTISVVPAS